MSTIPVGPLEWERLLQRGLKRNLENRLIHQTPVAALAWRCQCRDDNVASHSFYSCDSRQQLIRRHVPKDVWEPLQAPIHQSMSDNAYLPSISNDDVQFLYCSHSNVELTS